MKHIATILILALAVLVACTTVLQPPPTQPPQVPVESSFCQTASDCVCGGIDPKTGNCFIGNNVYYEQFVDREKQCPDFCGGIAGNLDIACVNNECTQVSRSEQPQETKASCEAKGGSWQQRFIGWFCNYPTGDVGKPCTDTKDCEGMCVAEDPNQDKGTCSQYQAVYGCVNLLSGGKMSVLCID